MWGDPQQNQTKKWNRKRKVNKLEGWRKVESLYVSVNIVFTITRWWLRESAFWRAVPHFGPTIAPPSPQEKKDTLCKEDKLGKVKFYIEFWVRIFWGFLRFYHSLSEYVNILIAKTDEVRKGILARSPRYEQCSATASGQGHLTSDSLLHRAFKQEFF